MVQAEYDGDLTHIGPVGHGIVAFRGRRVPLWRGGKGEGSVWAEFRARVPTKQSMASLNKFLWLQRSLIRARLYYYNRIWGMSLHPTVRMSMTAKFDRTYPRGMHIGEKTYVAFGAAILTHDMTRGMYVDTVIGRHCFIGAKSLIMPGVQIGDESIVAAGAVVTKDVPPRCIVAGNPAQIVRRDIEVGPYGRFRSVDAPKPVVTDADEQALRHG